MNVLIILIIIGVLFIAGCVSQNTQEETKMRSTDIVGITYKQLCDKNNDMWMQMQPMIDGKVVSSQMCDGCMIKNNHFCSVQDYTNYIRQIHGTTQTKLQQKQIQSINRSTAGLEAAEKTQIVELSDGETFSMEAKPISKIIIGNMIRMYAYNGQLPGPLIKVRQGSSIYVNFTNNLDMETTVHWHGIRLKNEFDGVPYITQKPINPGENFLYRLDFPDNGIYWYHPHVREDLQQELGLYGNILVEPNISYNSVDKEVVLFLDDIKINDGDVDTFTKDYTRFALMGRFGNIMLVNSETSYQIDANKNELVRLYITNSANTRTFNFSVEGHKMKLIGGDSGKYEKETFLDSLIIAPAERYIIEIYPNKSGAYKLLHRTPEKTYTIGTLNISDSQIIEKLVQFLVLKENNDVKLELQSIKNYLSYEPDYEIDLSIEMAGDGMMSMGNMDHGMMSKATSKIEWEDDMTAMNAMMTNENIKWIIRDKKTGKENMDINYSVKVGDKKKIRIFNDPNSAHPMQHPIHMHGQRFVVLSQDVKPNDNLVWKDTVLVSAGSTVDILVDFTNPGEWMIHCHIPEHMESGMMAFFTVSN